MKIIVTGANGMLGKSMIAALVNHQVLAFTSSQLDITCPHSTDSIVKSTRPDYIINCAAYTAVDQAESDQEKAYKINGIAVGKLAQIAKQYNATLVHFSTDYVFNGTSSSPYLTNEEVDPINAYGASKLAGEKAISLVGGNFYTFRISWLYAPHGKNFFRWVAETDSKELSIVNTQTGSPTSALDVATFIAHLVQNDPEKYGIYHFTNKGSQTWYDFAQTINFKLNLDKKIEPVDSFKTAAVRPAYSVMDVSATEKTFGYPISSIEEGLEEVVRQYRS
jgi:dTDP-4-dehydrorhamnose reductase